jgi:hypothetical protein
VIRTIVLMLACASLLLLGGCSNGPTIAEVEGTLTMDGKPLDGIQVEFLPELGPRSIGKTDAQGHFSLMTDDGKRKGAAIGSSRVVLKDVGILGGKFMGRAGEEVDMTGGKKSLLPQIYTTIQGSPLTAHVEAGKKNDIKLEIKP